MMATLVAAVAVAMLPAVYRLGFYRGQDAEELRHRLTRVERRQ